MSVINTNISSLNAQRNLAASGSTLATSLQRLSTGLRINSAKDDAAGMAIAERMTSQIRGNDQAARNANDGISLAQTAEGDLGQISTNLQRIRELAVQASNASNSASDRKALNEEATALISEIDRVANNSSFNGNKLLDGSFTAQTFQVGANNTDNDRIAIASIASAKANSLGVGSGSSYSSSVTSASSTASAAFTAGAVTINGFAVGASVDDGVSTAAKDSSAIAKAAAINAISAQTGVTAQVQSNSVTGGVTGTPATGVAGGANAVKINGVDIGAVAGDASAVVFGSNMAAAINKVSNQTGVTATAAADGKVTMTAADGRNIDIAHVGTAATATTGLTQATTQGTFKLVSTAKAGIVLGGSGATAAGPLGINSGVQTVTESMGAGVSSLDLTTSGGAQAALSTIDKALATVNSTRASLGAYQNRFASVVSSLQTTSENLSASRSRIQDADFAKETAALTRGQILQQAGTAMLAQANQLPNGVLSLLRGG